MKEFAAAVTESLIVIPFFLAISLFTCGLVVTVYGLRRMRREGWDGPPGWIWQSNLFVIVMEIVLLAGMDVAKFGPFFLEGWQGIMAITLTLFGPFIGLRVAKAFAEKDKVTIETAPTEKVTVETSSKEKGPTT